MDRETILALAPHYGVMMILVFGILGLWRTYIGQLDFIGEFAIIIVIVVLYKPIVKRLGVAPKPWQD